MTAHTVTIYRDRGWAPEQLVVVNFTDGDDAWVYASNCTRGRQGCYAIMRTDGVQVARFPEPKGATEAELRRHHAGIPLAARRDGYHASHHDRGRPVFDTD